MENKTIGIILSGGLGGRFESKIPKQYMSLNGKLVIQYSIDAFVESKLFDQIIIVADKNYHNLFPKYTVVQSGKTRNESIQNGLDACPENTEFVLFHDAARPFIKAADLKPYLDSLLTHSAAITSVKITDALYHDNRDNYKLIQTPEAFQYRNLRKYFDINKEYTAIYGHIFPAKIKFIELPHQNMKITYAQDLYLAEQLMKYKEVTKRTSNVKGKDILIFGGTGGIGSAVVKQLKELGANVVSLGSKEIDLSKSDIQYNKQIEVVYQKWDCIIHSVGAYAKDSEGFINTYDKIMNVNFRSLVYLVEHAETILKPNGSIICLGSTAASFGRPGIALYSASKSALNCFVEAVSPTLAKKGLRINVICPAKVATPLQTHINPDANQKDMIQPENLAEIIIGYIDTEKTGEIVYIKVGQE